MTMHLLKVDIPEPLATRLADLAERMQRTRDSLISEALQDWVDREERERLLIEVGQADVDAGRVVDHADVEAWVESLSTSDPLPVPRARR